MATETEIEETMPGPLPVWLEPDNDGLTPEALRPIYEKLDPSVTQVCERARRGIRDGYVRGVLEVHKALAPFGFFKDWCKAAGINYRTAHSIVARAEQSKRPKPEPEPEDEQADDTASPYRPPATDDDEPEDEPKDEPEPEPEPVDDLTPKPEDKSKPRREPKHQGKRTIHLTEDEEHADLIQRLRTAGDAEGLGTDKWTDIVTFLLVFYETHQSRRSRRARTQAAGEAA
jgi:hypothetical protein